VTGAQDAPDVVGWVTGIASGSGPAEAAVVEFFAPRVRAMLRARLRQPDAVQDLTQETLVAVLVALRKGQLREADRLPAFVHGVARNLANNYLRGEVRRAEAPLDDEVVRRLAGTAPVEEEARRALVARGLEAIAPTDREVLQLTLVDGLHPREIAQRLSLTSDVVRQRKARALKRLLAVVDPAGRQAAG
jgi:RNA polymerase sigma factor (sigma-70 family)